MHLIAIAMARQEMSLKKEELNFLPRFKNKCSEAPALISSLLLSNFLYRIFLGSCCHRDVSVCLCPRPQPSPHPTAPWSGHTQEHGDGCPINALAGKVNSSKAWKFLTEAIYLREIKSFNDWVFGVFYLFIFILFFVLFCFFVLFATENSICVLGQYSDIVRFEFVPYVSVCLRETEAPGIYLEPTSKTRTGGKLW